MTVVSETAKVKSAGKRHVSIAVPFRAIERNRSVAASVLAGGVAYRLFLWLLPFGLIIAVLLGLGNADGIEKSVSTGGLPEAMVNAIGDLANAANSNSGGRSSQACRCSCGRGTRARKRCS